MYKHEWFVDDDRFSDDEFIVAESIDDIVRPFMELGNKDIADLKKIKRFARDNDVGTTIDEFPFKNIIDQNIHYSLKLICSKLYLFQP